MMTFHSEFDAMPPFIGYKSLSASHTQVCCVCRRRSDGTGVYIDDRRNPRIAWACDDHIELANKALKMPRKQFDIYETQAIEEAGFEAGKYLDMLGKTDLAQLEPHEWMKFCKTIVDAFGKDLCKRVASLDPPF